jgi:hypothetical protein
MSRGGKRARAHALADLARAVGATRLASRRCLSVLLPCSQQNRTRSAFATTDVIPWRSNRPWLTQPSCIHRCRRGVPSGTIAIVTIAADEGWPRGAAKACQQVGSGRTKVRPRVSRLMWVKRSQEYLAKIDTGSPGALVQLVRDLQSTADGSRFSQRNLFDLALERLAAEFAAVDRIARLDAIDMLNHELAQAPAESAAGLHRPNVSL